MTVKGPSTKYLLILNHKHANWAEEGIISEGFLNNSKYI